MLAAVAAVIRQPRAGEQRGRPRPEALQGPGRGRRRGLAREPAGEGERPPERRVRADGTGLAPQQEPETGGHDHEQDQACHGAGQQARLRPAHSHDQQQGDDRQAQPGEDIPDTRDQRVQHVVGCADAPAGQHGPANAHGQGPARRKRVSHGGGAEVDHGRFAEPYRRQDRADHQPASGQAGRCRDEDKQDVRPGHCLDAGPDAAVGREMRERESEDGGDEDRGGGGAGHPPPAPEAA